MTCSRSRSLLFLACLLAADGAPRALAQTPPLSPEFQLNNFTTGDERNPTVFLDSAGKGFAVAWQRPGASGLDVAGNAFRLNGAPIGGSPEGLVNTYTTGGQFRPRVAGDFETQFVVVWMSGGQDGSFTGVFGQRYDNTGTPLGSEFQINTYTTGYQYAPAVAMNASNKFVVVWASDGQDGDKGGIFGQLYDNAGAKVGGEFQVNAYTTSYQYNPAVAMDSSGNFVVVWGSVGQDGSGTGIFARRYDSAGAAKGGEFQVNVTTTGEQGLPDVASDASGNFVVVWTGANFDGSGYGIVGRRFDASGNPRSGDFPINTYTTGNQALPRVAMDSTGNFLVAWHSKGQDDSAAPNGFGVFARAFSATGRPSSVEFPVNTFTTGDQNRPAVALDDRGDFVIAWESNGQDGDGYGIFGRSGGFPPAQALNVDAHSATGTSSDVDGVLEPGENVLVEPLWRNAGTTDLPLTGTASAFDGPAGALYTTADNSADYGTVVAATTSDCRGATANCYQFAVSAPASRPATHWDAQFKESLNTGVAKVWTLHLGDSFTDVPRSQPFYKKIETLLHNGITAGCTPTAYCPGDPVSRGQMAIFVAKGIAGTAALIPTSGSVGAQPYNCVSGGISLFTDVAATDIFCKHVHYIAAQNVTLGCSATQYCPGDTVTRLQMAAFIAKAIVAPGGGPAIPVSYGPDPVTGLSYSCNAGSPDVHFTDVPATDPFCKHVHYLWAKGIISGCGATAYCPASPVTRDAMAKFLTNAFELQLYGP
ncbi:MAG: S-layer homology domain-containing protein [Acidobacteriota bacterium]